MTRPRTILLVVCGVALLSAGARADTPWELKVQAVGTPKAFYRVDEASGNTMAAKVGTNGDYQASVTYSITGSPIHRCETNTAVEKAGTIATGGNWAISDNTFTLMVFMKAASAPAALSHLLLRGTAALLQGYMIAVTTTGVAQCTVRNTDLVNVSAIGVTSIVDNIWHMIVCTYDGANVTIYVDNVSDATAAQTGNVQAGGGTTYVTGPSGPNVTISIDEPVIYDALLTPAQLTDLFMFSKQCGGGSDLTMEF